MIKIPQWPATRVVAGLTARTVHFLVLIVLHMTADTITPRIPEARRLVTTLASGQHVTTGQCIAGPVVVKTLNLPVDIGMATLALGSDLTFMLVVLLVTTYTLHGRVAIALDVFMARLALDLYTLMCVFQAEFGFIVVKQSRLPVAIGMAIGTFVAQRGDVLVVLLVACHTLLAGLLVHGAFVTQLALNLDMFAEQGEVSLGVIKLG